VFGFHGADQRGRAFRALNGVLVGEEADVGAAPGEGLHGAPSSLADFPGNGELDPATELVNAGVSPATIRKRLGHHNLQTTQHYTEQSDAVANAELRAWRRRVSQGH
jgi:integrase